MADMSQRLHIGPTDNPVYEAVIATEADATEDRMADWLQNGPWKIRIGDLALWRKVEPAIADLFPGCFPNDVWAFYMGDRNIQHPTASELRAWLDEPVA
jgi:hypothetical protein